MNQGDGGGSSVPCPTPCAEEAGKRIYTVAAAEEATEVVGNCCW